MPRALILLGIAALLALLLVFWRSGEDSAPGPVDGTQAATWREGGAAPEPASRASAPTLKGSGTAATGAKADGKAADGEPKKPTGPYEIVVLAFESEAFLADVEITDDAGEPLGKTDEQGTLMLVDAGVSELVFRATKDGYVTHRGRALPDRITQVVLQSGVSIRGHVVRASGGTPIADASVIVWDEDLEREIASVSTDAEGRYVISAVRPNHPVQFIVRTTGLVPHVQRELFHVALKDFTIRIGEGGRLIGTVTTAEEKPLAGVELRLLWGGEPIAEHRPVADESARADARLASTRTAVTHTDEEGRYEFLAVPLNRFVRPVAVVKPRFVVRSREKSGHVFRDLDETAEIDIVVPPPCALRIRIQDEKGAPIGHADVALRAGGSAWPLLPADAHDEGGYLVEDLPASTVIVTASLPGAPVQTERVELATGQTSEVTLTFPIGRGLTGTVQDKHGQPIWKALVSWTGNQKGDAAATRADEKGRFALSRLESKTGTLRITARDLPWTPQTYERQVFKHVSPGPRPIEVMLLDGTRAIGRFDDLPPGAVISSMLAGGTRYDEIDHHLKADGRFGRRGPPRDMPALFVFRTRGYPPLLVREDRPFVSEEVRDLGRLLFEASNPRLGRIVDEAKQPIHGARVQLQTGWSSRATRTDVVGDFAFPRLPDLRIPLEIQADGFPRTGATLETSSQFQRQVIVLRRAAPLRVEVFRPKGPVRGTFRITVYQPAKRYRPGDPAPILRRRSIDAQSAATFHLPPGRYAVAARQDPHRGRPLAGLQMVVIGSAPTNRVRVPLALSK